MKTRKWLLILASCFLGLFGPLIATAQESKFQFAVTGDTDYNFLSVGTSTTDSESIK